MKFGMEQMDEMTENLLEEKMSYLNSVIVGDNSSGKSLLLKKFIEEVRKSNRVYFIDAVNRNFDVKKISKLENKPEYKSTIIETRMREEYFNLKDSFNCFGTSTERVEMIYRLYEDEVQKLFHKLTTDRFDLIEGDVLGEVDFGNGKGLLSSGYQALIRILLELLYYKDVVIEKEKVENAWIVIDELDEFLSPKYSARIMEFLKAEFPWAKWVVTTHSCDLVANTFNSNLVILDNGLYEILDINDYASVSEVQLVFDRLFEKENLPENEIENTLRRLFNNKINNVWGTNEETSLEKIQKEQLSASQKLILRQIQKW